MNILIVGATSAIAQETAKCFAAQGANLFLVGRNTSRLATIQTDLTARGAHRVETYALDLNDFDRHQAMLDTARESFGKIDMVLIAHGTLGNQHAAEQSVAETLRELNTNGLSVIALLTLLAPSFERQKGGVIAVITSVAGDRGRQSNYVYGTAKGAVNVFLQGLRNRLATSHVAVITLKLGFVDTPMTADVKKNFLFAKPATVGAAIHQVMLKPKDVVYIPSFWRFVMLIITSIPERLFKRLKL